MIVKKLAIRPSRPDEAEQFCRGAIAEDGLEAVEQRGARGADAPRPAADPGVEEQREEAEDEQGVHPQIVPLGTSRFGSIDSSAASGTSSIAR